MTTTEHVAMKQFDCKNHELTVGNKTLTDIEILVGTTPFYAYDRQIISQQISKLKHALPERIKIHYAVKANPLPALVHYIEPLVDGFDVASKKEMLLALQSGMAATNISYAGPGKTNNDIAAAVVAGVTLHVESINEIVRVTSIADKLHMKANIAIRVNPTFELKSSGMKMSGGAKPFGIDEELLPDVIKNLNNQLISLKGFHIFAGSQNLNCDAIIEMHQNVFALAEQLFNLASSKIDYINIGGGLGIPYFPKETQIDINKISQNLSLLLTEYTKLSDVELIMELGRYLVGEAGIYVSKIVDKKTSRGTTYLICDGGLHHHLANSGNFGQVIRRNYPVAIGNKMDLSNAKLENVNISGPLCTPLDIIAEKVTLPVSEIGDYVVVFQSGAYGATASPQQFLSQPDVSEILL